MKYSSREGGRREEGKLAPLHITIPKIPPPSSRPSSPSPFPSSFSPSLPSLAPGRKISLRTSLWPQDREAARGQGAGSTLQEHAQNIYSQLFPVVSVQLGSLSLGLNLAFITVVTPQLGEEAQNSWQPLQWAGPIYLLCLCLGSLLCSLASPLLGRKSLLVASSLPDCLGWGLASLSSLLPPAYTLPLLLTGRALNGLAAGLYLSTMPVYIAEIVQTEHRGWMTGLTLPITSIGVMCMYLLASWLPWPQAALVCTAPPLVMALAVAQLPDSPYSLFLRGREKEAHSALEQLRGGGGALAEVLRIQDSVDRDRLEGGLLARFRLLATQKKYYSPFFILNFLIFIILFTGVTSLHLYAHEIFQRAGGHSDLYLSNIVIGLIQLVGSCLFLVLVKLYSRKLLLVTSSLAMSTSLSLLGLYLYSQTRREEFFLAVAESQWLAVLSLATALAAAPCGLCSVPLLYTAELFPTEMRSLLSGLTVCLSSLGLLGSQLLFPVMEHALLPHGVTWLAAVACVLAILFTLTSIPETRHKDLSEIPDKFAEWRKEARASPWVTPMHSPSHSRCTTPSRELKNIDLKRQMFTK